MSVLSGYMIRDRNIITPFQYKTIGRDNLSGGMSLAGYDCHVEFDSQGEKDWIYLNPGQFKLASTQEQFTMPSDVMGVVHDKSTWIRKGLAVHNTVIEPGWIGYLTLELKNEGTDTLQIWKGDPICQVVFHQMIGQTDAYSGKYQGQGRGPQKAR